MKLQNEINEALLTFEKRVAPTKASSLHGASATVSKLAVLYEKARNAVEFRADHLVRRASVERIMKRLFLTSREARVIAENLTLELIWSRYVDSSLIDDEKINVLSAIIERYLILKTVYEREKSLDLKINWDDLLGIAASEIDESLFTNEKEEALIKFFYVAVRSKIKIDSIDEEMLDMYTYVAVKRAFTQAEDTIILTNLLKMSFPAWFRASAEESERMAPAVIHALSFLKSNFKNPQIDKIHRYVRTQMPPFLVIRDFLFEKQAEARDIIQDKAEFIEELEDVIETRYKEIGSKVKTASIRSFIYIFLTKMVFAFAIEVPFDLYIEKSFSYLPLTINTVFPPFLLVLLASFFKVPGEENTQKLTERVSKIIYSLDEYKKEKDSSFVGKKEKKSKLAPFFSLLYFATFAFTFGAINHVLTLLDFSIVSKFIFVFFIALVSFFAYRIRLSAKEYEVVEDEGMLVSILDFFFLPILRAGQVLSRGIAKLNILTFFFDFILEAPLKTILSAIEEWLRFVRAKREEIV